MEAEEFAIWLSGRTPRDIKKALSFVRIWARQQKQCTICGELIPWEILERNLDLATEINKDHIIPESLLKRWYEKIGVDESHRNYSLHGMNIAIVHTECNTQKADKIIHAAVELAKLFNIDLTA